MSSIPFFFSLKMAAANIGGAKTLITNFRACSCVKARAPPGENILPILIVIAIVATVGGEKMVFLCFSSRELRLSKFGAEFARRHTERER